MNYFNYYPKQITELEYDSKVEELFLNSTFQIGDSVRLRNDVNSPIMSITKINVSKQDISYNKLARMFISATCTYFNKSSQSFVSTDLSVLCLDKVS